MRRAAASHRVSLWVRELERRTREITLLNEMADLLQTCLTVVEAHAVIAQFAQRLFESESGALYILNDTRVRVEAVAAWGESPLRERSFDAAECWGIRRSRLYFVDDAHPGPLCGHVNGDVPGPWCCVPLVVQGEPLGLLHLRHAGPAAEPGPATQDSVAESRQRLAMALTHHAARALANLRLRERLRSQAIRDPVTALFNRRYMEETLTREIFRALRRKSPLGIIMLDIDYFKRFNDTFGHPAGDVLLRKLGHFLQTHTRGEDVACRYGGEEFALIMPDTPLPIVRERAQQLCTDIASSTVTYHGQSLGRVTVSGGVATFPDHGLNGEAVLRAADAALYRAKAAGRNRVVAAE